MERSSRRRFFCLFCFLGLRKRAERFARGRSLRELAAARAEVLYLVRSPASRRSGQRGRSSFGRAGNFVDCGVGVSCAKRVARTARRFLFDSRSERHVAYHLSSTHQWERYVQLQRLCSATCFVRDSAGPGRVYHLPPPHRS
uniref:Uncharacterized protein n=1 Tax=Ixodes ricinus TaxID=34613 RepID=A0A6B0UTN9_IXORI